MTAEALQAPSPWPNANARLLGLGLGLPVPPLDRLKNFSDKEFERFTLEWATGYLVGHVPGVHEIQQRGGAGDKGRDIILWRDRPSTKPRRWRLYQCKHYADRLAAPEAYVEIAKVLFYTWRGDYTPPEEYWFVTHQGVAETLQDLLHAPDKLKTAILANWEKHCAKKITLKSAISLTPELQAHIEAFDFSIFRAKQPLALIEEHAKTKFHAVVFGLPLIERPPPPKPPSTVHAQESGYVEQLFAVIAEHLGISVAAVEDFAHATAMKRLFDRSRLTFYSAEGLKELARDQIADQAFFDTLLDEFCDGLFHAYAESESGQTGLERLRETVKAAQSLQLGGHVLTPHVTANDREGACHQLANKDRVQWCEPCAQTLGSRPSRLFNTPLECGFRLAIILDAVSGEPDLQRLVSYDYLLVHSGDVEGGPASLHPAVPFRGTELLVKRELVHQSLDDMFSRELLEKRMSSSGITYVGTPLTHAFARLLQSGYANELKVRAEWLSRRFGSLNDSQLTAFMSANVGRWGAEFERLTSLRTLEL